MENNDIRAMVSSIVDAAQHEDGYVIVRVQSRQEWGMRLANGRFERVSAGWEGGIGVQAFTRAGASGFASADGLAVEVGRDLVKRSFALAKRNEQIGAELNREIWQASRAEAEVPSPAKRGFEEFSLKQIQAKVQKIHDHLREIDPATIWQTSYRQVEDFWCIGRSDGTLVSFAIPRAVLMQQGTVRAGGRAQSTLVHRSGTDISVVLAEAEDYLLEQKAVDRAEFARMVCQAPPLPAGHYPLIIDYGLAKGLAHEAFGHAVESDHMQESVLGENGRLKRGLKVARSGVHIIDGPLAGDWAFQPYSANGISRATVRIVEDGVLQTGLGDVFSAKAAGMEVTGAGRAESYGYIPLPRMTNIRLIVDREIPLNSSPRLMEEVQALRDVLLAHREIEAGKKNLLLLGYRGGQVNPKTGDFVFQCDGMIDLADPNLPVYQAAIFSGKILSALQAIRGGVGEGCFNAIGTCGKGGQAVPSSGGSHRYLLLDEDPQVNLGGAQV